jgi:hypothetical protein
MDCEQNIILLNEIYEDEGAMRYISDELRDNKEFMLEAIKINIMALQYASERIKNDKDFIINAIYQDCDAFVIASNELRGNEEVALVAANEHIHMIKFASDKLRDDEQFLCKIHNIKTIKHKSRLFFYLSKRIQNEIENNSKYLIEYNYVMLKPGKK